MSTNELEYCAQVFNYWWLFLIRFIRCKSYMALHTLAGTKLAGHHHAPPPLFSPPPSVMELKPPLPPPQRAQSHAHHLQSHPCIIKSIGALHQLLTCMLFYSFQTTFIELLCTAHACSIHHFCSYRYFTWQYVTVKAYSIYGMICDTELCKRLSSTNESLLPIILRLSHFFSFQLHKFFFRN